MSKGSTRFSSEDYLRDFRASGAFPEIHDPLFQLVLSEALGTSGVDLACCYGLLGERISKEADISMFGVEFSQDFITAGLDAGIDIPMYQMEVKAETLMQLLALVKKHSATVLVARRAFPEIFPEPESQFCRDFVEGIHGAGIKEVFLQGRLESARSTHPLSGIDKEGSILLSHYRKVKQYGQLAYFVAL